MMLDAVLAGIGILALFTVGGIFTVAVRIVRWISSAEPPPSGDDHEPTDSAGPPA